MGKKQGKNEDEMKADAAAKAKLTVAIYAIVDSNGNFLYVGASKAPMKECCGKSFSWRGYKFQNCNFKILVRVKPSQAAEIEGSLIVKMKRVGFCLFNTNGRRMELK